MGLNDWPCVFMMFPQVSMEEWCEQHKLVPLERKCKNGCGKILKTTIPVATKKCRGLKSEPHECGPEYDLVTLRPICKEFLDLLNSF